MQINKRLELIDTTFAPDPWHPAKGDVYCRPTTMGWERVIVLHVQEACMRPSLLDILDDVQNPCMVTFIDGNKGEEMTKTADMFRAWITCFDFRPSGRMRGEPVAENA